ncbi:MAG: hypothetical protein A3H64_00470 [Candidatus Ryanbacteria bacterium RIFCSPLOWO2_02_FULL_45_11c]|uniref:Uncharacterized protein n=1 Tax=Candidatus Ryanbacteria bacterium RIFCSPLOWO2_02_FULL_45_11c TaxID=1802128 RepID=A0A1G2GVB4_9BACT|nr:MAG: hypothetical protein A3H64_00470 [Candidatus Ryanbacteria bacterium RIFCSPLOWO2_02_FULL_45_11c]
MERMTSSFQNAVWEMVCKAAFASLSPQFANWLRIRPFGKNTKTPSAMGGGFCFTARIQSHAFRG